MTGDPRDPPNQPTSSPQHADLRHITSNPALLSASPPRQPHHQLSSHTPNSSRGGSRSPTSIPSSPTSIHSSSSAIFERDIESLPSASPHQTHHHPPNPHRTPRSKATEQLDQAVPNVLAEAASAFAISSDGDIAVIAPATAPTPLSLSGSVGSRSPPLRSRSPSPSPSSRKTSLPAGTSAGTSLVTPRPHPPAHRMSTGPLPPGAFSTPPRSPVPSPTTAVSTLPPAPLPEPVHATPAHQKRLSFISYSDLLSSTPITALPLSSFTAPNSAAPPPHLPAVSAAATLSSPPASQGAPSRPLSSYSISTGMSGGGGRGGGLGEEQQGVGKRLKDDIGGEWEREGFGKGLEERLEELMVGKA